MPEKGIRAGAEVDGQEAAARLEHAQHLCEALPLQIVGQVVARHHPLSWRQQFLLNPVKKQRAKEKAAQNLCCPSCGQRMLARPYNYQYFIPVDKCLSCYKIWFDADELEILQILVEKKA